MYRSDFPRTAARERQLPVLGAGYLAFERIGAPSRAMARHSHGYGVIVIVLDGDLIERVHGGVRDCRVDSVFVERPGEWHTTRYGASGVRLLTLRYIGDAASEALRFGLEPDEGSALGLPSFAAEFRAALQDDDADGRLTFDQLQAELFAMVTSRNVAEWRTTGRRWLREVRDRVHASYLEPLTLSGLAASVGVVPDHLSRVFRRTFSCDIGTYVRQLRIDEARRRIARTDMALTTIAVELGFADASHFARTFRRCVGMSPTEYRAASRR